MDQSSEQDQDLPAPRVLRTSRGDAVAPIAALTGTPMAWVGRSSASASPLDVRSPLGNPEAPSAGGLGGGAPLRGGAAAPNLDTYGTTPPRVPSRAALYGNVTLTLAEYRERVAHELKRLALWHAVPGKRRRNFARKARALLACGQFARVQRCGTCGNIDQRSARVLCDCDLRSCPTCARLRADDFRGRLGEKWRAGERPRGMGLYFLTFTLRYDPSSPEDLSVEGLQRRKQIVRAAVGAVWKKYLKRRGRAMALAVEVSPRGAVHVHALYHGRRPDVGTLRRTYMFHVGDSPMVNLRYVRKPAKGIRELAKYMTKAASPKKVRLLRGGCGEFVDPVLAARAEVAFSGDRLFECMGAWRGADDDEESVPDDASRVLRALRLERVALRDHLYARAAERASTRMDPALRASGTRSEANSTRPSLEHGTCLTTARTLRHGSAPRPAWIVPRSTFGTNPSNTGRSKAR